MATHVTVSLRRLYTTCSLFEACQVCIVRIPLLHILHSRAVPALFACICYTTPGTGCNSSFLRRCFAFGAGSARCCHGTLVCDIYTCSSPVPPVLPYGWPLMRAPLPSRRW